MTALSEFGVSAQDANNAFAAIMDKSKKTVGSWSQFFSEMTKLDNIVKKQVDGFKAMDKAVDDATDSLSGQAVSMADLQKAQNALARATSFSIEGIVKLDKAKLNNLQEQIKQAQKQMNSLADTAKTTMQDLDAELASLQGREMDSQRIKQAQKLADLQAKMAEAVARGNVDEIAHYQKALSLQ
ncbi:hypothetical protein, partial [Moraxella equi]